MIRLYLPFEMGKVVYFNPVSYETEYDHPVLNIGSSHASVKSEICDWMSHNYGYCHTGFDGQTGKYFVAFRTEEDKTNFALRWL